MLKKLVLVLQIFNSCSLISCVDFVPEYLQHLSLQVQTPKGTLQGSVKRTKDQGVQYFSFQGIPYALPPIGDLRFKDPVPFKGWEGVLDASKENLPSCIQILPTMFGGTRESEDCLFLSIFSPTHSLNSIDRPLMPVMVWIHGGGFLVGNPDVEYYGPDYFMEHKIVLVQISYRLSSLGFLSTEDMESPGNYGLKDQHIAFRWIKENIEYFGGDPNEVTIFGESAGAASVQYHMLNLENKGLFHRAISQSGSSLCMWSYQRHPRSVAFDFGAAVGIKTKNSKELMEKLRRVPVEIIKAATMRTMVLHSLSFINGMVFGPSIEPWHDHAFLTNKTHQLLLEGKFIKVPHIVGFNSEETSMAKQGLSLANPLLQIINFDRSVMVPADMNAGENTEECGKEIWKFYTSNSKPRSEQYIDFVNDGYFFRPIIESARLIGRETPTYLYIFAYEGLIGRNAMGCRDVGDYRGVSHAEEMTYIFSRNDLPTPTLSDNTTIARMLRMWTNFARTGNPTPVADPLLEDIRWPAVDESLNYLEINKNLIPKAHIKEDMVKFWRETYYEYGHPPFDTY
nr:unnamed protein product [Callosobruchus analis]